MEYPGYGVYEGISNEQQILEDALKSFDYIQNKEGYLANQIIVFGRSLGSGPATFVAAERNPGALILMSPFATIKGLILSYLGIFKGLASHFINESFNNEEMISKVKCPTLLLHGEMDNVIPIENSNKLIKKKGDISYNFSKTMTHNDFVFTSDIIYPIQNFLNILKN